MAVLDRKEARLKLEAERKKSLIKKNIVNALLF